MLRHCLRGRAFRKILLHDPCTLSLVLKALASEKATASSELPGTTLLLMVGAVRARLFAQEYLLGEINDDER
jgi:hypothetical protein